MRCVSCKEGETALGTKTMTVERDTTVVVIRNVPAQVCQTCGEAYLEGATMTQLSQLVNEAAHAGVQVDVRLYRAA